MRYFVIHRAKLRTGQPANCPFEIQILDSQGRAKYVGYVGHSEETLDIAGHSVPKAVLDAVRRRPKGPGDYVDSEGNSIQPF